MSGLGLQGNFGAKVSLNPYLKSIYGGLVVLWKQMMEAIVAFILGLC